jgi:hypothetical protein
VIASMDRIGLRVRQFGARMLFARPSRLAQAPLRCRIRWVPTNRWAGLTQRGLSQV